MARDKLITIRIEGEKREAFNNLAKSQNTDTASLLYDFINQCLDGKIDIKLVTGKGNRIDKLEATTQRIDHWIGALSERVNDWILRSDRRVNDCEKGLSDKMVSLEHRLNALSIQLDSQRIDSIDTDSQQIDDMEPLIKEALRLDHLDDQRLIDAIESRIEDTEIDESDYEPDTSPLPNQETVESDSTIEPVTGSIGPVGGDSDSINTGKGEGMNPNQSRNYLKKKGVKDISYYYLNKWAKDGVIDTSPQGRDALKHLILRNKLYYPIN